MKLKDLITTRDNRLSSSKIAFWIFFAVFIFRFAVFGSGEVIEPLVWLFALFLGYKGVKVWKLN